MFDKINVFKNDKYFICDNMTGHSIAYFFGKHLIGILNNDFPHIGISRTISYSSEKHIKIPHSIYVIILLRFTI